MLDQNVLQKSERRKVTKVNMNTMMKMSGRKRRLLQQHQHLLLNQLRQRYQLQLLLAKLVLVVLTHSATATLLEELPMPQQRHRITLTLRLLRLTLVDLLRQNHLQLNQNLLLLWQVQRQHRQQLQHLLQELMEGQGRHQI